LTQLLNVKNLTIAKENLIAVDNISFYINKGEITGLAGESGCGKTMTALAIMNLLPQDFKITNGNILYNKEDNNLSDIKSMSEKELNQIRGKEIGIIFQDVKQSLNPLMKIGSQINENKNTTREQVIEILNILGLPESIYNAYAHQLSVGMCQRVMLAIAAINRPKLLLADEPSSALDEESQKITLSYLLEMNQKYKTSVFIISHDLSIIKKYCSRYIIMYAGKIVEEGPADLLYSPLHPYTSALIEAIPEQGKNIKSIPGKVPSIEDNLPGCPFAPRCYKAVPKCTKGFPEPVNINSRCVYCNNPL